MIDRDAWFHTMPGSLWLSQEKAALDRLLQNKHGTDLLQIGGPDDPSLIEKARVFRTFLVDNKMRLHPTKPFMRAESDALPIQSESMDIVLLLHELEKTKHPMDILREAYRVLRPNGQLIIFGSNRLGVWRLCRSQQHHLGKPRAAHTVKRQLRRLHFDVTVHQTLCFRPPFHSEATAKTFLFLETLGQFFLPYAGAVYMLAATKNIPGMTPLVVNGFRSARVCEIK